ncbi:TonB-dependent receptor plug domain-containing protein [Aliikangiella coralliicola]|uniref:TonB-dependent receptor n=1 Tax=Aliikangiella coralliicola TaxID=2592383 RepID=A0A545UJ91_9GAMM|nr:TonB-dependent receptor [Aliikangiella coralliicola]TQV89528.1 TonB-dependent receptor [Aliikangiella coralliicola]
MKKTIQKPLKKSVVSIVVASALSINAHQVFAQDDASINNSDSSSASAISSTSEGKKDEQKIVITGSRIQRTDMESAKPVSIITKEEIRASGLNDIASILAQSIFNSAGASIAHSNNSAGNFSASNLRGLGSNRTLTLVNGRRVAPSSSLYGASVNVNLIPIEVVERIDILRDGASSIYGSDAMGGVINIITKKDYDGLQLSLNHSKPTRGGAEQTGGALTFGTSSDKSSLLVVLEHQTNNSLKGGERPHLDAEFNERRWSSRYSPWGTYRYRDANGDYAYAPGPNCPEENITERTGGTQCGYDVRDGKYYLPKVEKTSIFTNFNYSLSDDLEFYNSILYTRDDTFTSATPMWASGTLAADNPNNPTFGTSMQQEVRYYHYMEGALPREFTFETDLLDINAGVNWDTDHGTLSINFAHSTDRFVQESNYYYFRDKYDEAVENGLYNPLAPAGGPNATEEVLDSFRHSQHRIGESVSKSITIDWSGMSSIELAGGEIGYAAGIESRKLSVSDEQDAQSNSGNVFGAYGGDTVGKRNYKAAYLEVELPVLDSLTLSAATRYDDYSLPDQGQLSSSFSTRYEATDDLVLRASFSQGFRVADLNEAMGDESISYGSYSDPKYCNPVPIEERDNSELCERNEIPVRSFSNPDLEPEESEQFSYGIAYNLTEKTGVTLDYWNIEITNRITSISGKTILDEEYLGNLGNYTGLYVTRDLTQPRQDEIVEIGSTTTNYLGLDTSGIDASITSQFDFDEYGRLKANLEVSHVLEYNFQKTSVDPVYDYAGYYNRPETRASLNFNYFYNNFEAFSKVRYIDSFLGESPEDEAEGIEYLDFPSMTTLNLGVAYDFGDYGRVQLISNNVLDKLPPVNSELSRGYSYRIHSIIGRTIQLNYTKDF